MTSNGNDGVGWVARHEHPRTLGFMINCWILACNAGAYRPVSYGAKKTVFTSAQGTSDEHRNP